MKNKEKYVKIKDSTTSQNENLIYKVNNTRRLNLEK